MKPGFDSALAGRYLHRLVFVLIEHRCVRCLWPFAIRYGLPPGRRSEYSKTLLAQTHTRHPLFAER